MVHTVTEYGAGFAQGRGNLDTDKESQGPEKTTTCKRKKIRMRRTPVQAKEEQDGHAQTEERRWTDRYY